MSLAKVTFIKLVKVSRYELYVTLARLIYKLHVDGRRPKHVGAVLK